jgi:NAD-dependent SIR2 family protein deacetylase
MAMVFTGTGFMGHKQVGQLTCDYFHCTECGGDYWFSPTRQKCLRKDVKCPECDKKNKKG